MRSKTNSDDLAATRILNPTVKTSPPAKSSLAQSDTAVGNKKNINRYARTFEFTTMVS